MHTDLTSVNINSSEHHINYHMVKWTPPPDGCVKLNIDENCGASGDIVLEVYFVITRKIG